MFRQLTPLQPREHRKRSSYDVVDLLHVTQRPK